MQAVNISESGRRAFLVGIKATENPFHIGSQARSLWAKGWRQARDGKQQANATPQATVCAVTLTPSPK